MDKLILAAFLLLFALVLYAIAAQEKRRQRLIELNAKREAMKRKVKHYD